MWQGSDFDVFLSHSCLMPISLIVFLSYSFLVHIKIWVLSILFCSHPFSSILIYSHLFLSILLYSYRFVRICTFPSHSCLQVSTPVYFLTIPIYSYLFQTYSCLLIPVYLSVYLSVCLFVCLSVHPSMHPSIFIYVNIYIYKSLSLSINQPICVSINLLWSDLI